MALLFVALFGLSAVGYSADTRSMVLKGNKAYKAKHYARARALFDRACRGGDDKGCYNLGVMFSKGDGGARDEARARALFAQACKGGFVKGCYNLGLMFSKGDGGARDFARALFDQTCKGGNAKGCSKLQ